MKFEEAKEYMEKGYYAWINACPCIVYYKLDTKYYYRCLVTLVTHEVDVNHDYYDTEYINMWSAAKSIPFSFVKDETVEIIY